MAAATTELIAGQVFGQYKLVRQLGRGGLGVVWLADNFDLGTKVAIIRHDKLVAFVVTAIVMISGFVTIAQNVMNLYKGK